MVVDISIDTDFILFDRIVEPAPSMSSAPEVPSAKNDAKRASTLRVAIISSPSRSSTVKIMITKRLMSFASSLANTNRVAVVMNLPGASIKDICEDHKISPSDITIVVFDREELSDSDILEQLVTTYAVPRPKMSELPSGKMPLMFHLVNGKAVVMK